MHSNPAPRRRHSAEFKVKVLSACNEPGASIAAVALSHGLNANLVRKWVVGRGLKRTGIPAPIAVKTSAAATTPPTAAPLLAADAPIWLKASQPLWQDRFDVRLLEHQRIHIGRATFR